MIRARWQRWHQASANRKIFAAILTVGSLTVVAKLATVLKDIVVASRLGTHDALDAFLVALAIPGFARTVVGGAVNGALVPTYISVGHDHGRAAQQRLLASTMTATLGLVAAITAALWLLGPVLLPLVGSSFGSAKAQLTLDLYHVLLPIVAVSSLSVLWSGVLNAENRFALAAFLPFVTPAVTVVALLAARGLGIYALAIGTVAGVALEAVVLGMRLKTLGISLIPRWAGFDPALRAVTGQFFPMAAGSILMGTSPVVDQAFAATLGGGTIAALSYGNKLVALATGVGALAISTAVLPHLSRMVAAQDWGAVRHTLRTYVGLILAVAVPATLLVVLASKLLVTLLFQRGAFTSADTQIVATIQTCYFLQLPFYLVGTLGVAMISAMKANRLLVWISAANVATNVAGDYLLMRVIGAPGIALSTAVVYLVSSLAIFAALYRYIPRAATAVPAG